MWISQAPKSVSVSNTLQRQISLLCFRTQKETQAMVFQRISWQSCICRVLQRLSKFKGHPWILVGRSQCILFSTQACSVRQYLNTNVYIQMTQRTLGLPETTSPSVQRNPLRGYCKNLPKESIKDERKQPCSLVGSESSSRWRRE